MKRLLFILFMVLSTHASAVTFNISQAGWHLLGTDQNISNVAAFNDCARYMWKYDGSNPTNPWQIYSPTGHTFDYATFNSFDAYDGFWILAKQGCTINAGDDNTTTPPDTPKPLPSIDQPTQMSVSENNVTISGYIDDNTTQVALRLNGDAQVFATTYMSGPGQNWNHTFTSLNEGNNTVEVYAVYSDGTESTRSMINVYLNSAGGNGNNGFTVEYLNGKTLYNTYYEEDIGQWTITHFQFSDQNFTFFDDNNQSYQYVLDYNITQEGYITFVDDGPQEYVKRVNETADAIELCWEDNISMADGCTVGSEYFYFDYTKAVNYVTAQNGGTPPADSNKTTMKVIDPYITGAQLWADINGDEIQDANELSTFSDSNGSCEFNASIPDGTLIQMVHKGMHNGKPFEGDLKAHFNSAHSLISPITTMGQIGFSDQELVDQFISDGLTGMTSNDLYSDPFKDLIPLNGNMSDANATTRQQLRNQIMSSVGTNMLLMIQGYGADQATMQGIMGTPVDMSSVGMGSNTMMAMVVNFGANVFDDASFDSGSDMRIRSRIFVTVADQIQQSFSGVDFANSADVGSRFTSISTIPTKLIPDLASSYGQAKGAGMVDPTFDWKNGRPMLAIKPAIDLGVRDVKFMLHDQTQGTDINVTLEFDHDYAENGVVVGQWNEVDGKVQVTTGKELEVHGSDIVRVYASGDSVDYSIVDVFYHGNNFNSTSDSNAGGDTSGIDFTIADIDMAEYNATGISPAQPPFFFFETWGDGNVEITKLQVNDTNSSWLDSYNYNLQTNSFDLDITQDCEIQPSGECLGSDNRFKAKFISGEMNASNINGMFGDGALAYEFMWIPLVDEIGLDDNAYSPVDDTNSTFSDFAAFRSHFSTTSQRSFMNRENDDDYALRFVDGNNTIVEYQYSTQTVVNNNLGSWYETQAMVEDINRSVMVMELNSDDYYERNKALVLNQGVVEYGWIDKAGAGTKEYTFNDVAFEDFLAFLGTENSGDTNPTTPQTVTTLGSFIRDIDQATFEGLNGVSEIPNATTVFELEREHNMTSISKIDKNATHCTDSDFNGTDFIDPYSVTFTYNDTNQTHVRDDGILVKLLQTNISASEINATVFTSGGIAHRLAYLSTVDLYEYESDENVTNADGTTTLEAYLQTGPRLVEQMDNPSNALYPTPDGNLTENGSSAAGTFEIIGIYDGYIDRVMRMNITLGGYDGDMILVEKDGVIYHGYWEERQGLGEEYYMFDNTSKEDFINYYGTGNAQSQGGATAEELCNGANGQAGGLLVTVFNDPTCSFTYSGSPAGSKTGEEMCNGFTTPFNFPAQGTWDSNNNVCITN
jgi:hypothetical protein